MWLLALALQGSSIPGLAASVGAAEMSHALEALSRALPPVAADFNASQAEALQTAADSNAQAAGRLFETLAANPRRNSQAALRQLLEAKDQVDRLLQETLARRGELAQLPDTPNRIHTLRAYLASTATLIDLSGRLRYLLFDAIRGSTRGASGSSDQVRQLLALLTEYRSEPGAAMLVPWLFTSTREESAQGPTIDESTKLRILRLIAVSRQADLVEELARYLREGRPSARLTIAAAQTLREVGIPQDPRPGQDPQLPRAAITAGQLHAMLVKVDPSGLDKDLAKLHAELVQWLDRRRREGVFEDVYRWGKSDLRSGDWLLMRNPSPYNLFTDLSPGLFTHVGVVTAETGTDGKRRIVLVDMPEQGAEMPATNIDVFLVRTLQFVFLRHADPQVGKTMSQVAESVIGNPTLFDLNFRTERVEALKGQPLEDETIHTYCAGLLLLCAQETDLQREAFFPFSENSAGGKTSVNLAQLGLSLGDDFVSPTGALFSPNLEIVGWREPMYSPTREIEEAVYDHFAQSLQDKTLAPSNTLKQSLRTKLAEAAEVTPLLGRALAEAYDVSPEMDLAAAARAAAVVETLDEIAHGASDGFLLARDVLRAGSNSELARLGFSPEEIQSVQALQERHRKLLNDQRAGRLSPRQVRVELVRYYVDLGKQQLDERFFAEQR
jgi:hypothetical protein